MKKETMGAIEIVCDRPSHLYRAGEEAIFTVTAPRDGVKVEVIFSTDGYKEFSRVRGTTPFTVKETLSFPGFLRCTAEADGFETGLAAAAFSPHDIRPALPPPEDFRDFWQKALHVQEKIPANFKKEELTSLADETFQFFLLECDTVQNKKCYAFLRIPRSEEPMPLLVYYDGSGPGLCQDLFKLHCQTADKWMPARSAHLCIFTHPYHPPVTWKEHEKLYKEYLETLGGDYLNENLEKGPEHTFFYRAILGSLRMIKYAGTFKEVDKDRIVYMGVSQGGSFGFYLTALSPLIKAGCFCVPGFCDCGGFRTGAHDVTSGIEAFRMHYKVMRYFDPVNFAPMIKVPVYVSCGFIDTACPPSGIYAAYNELMGNKMMFHKTCHGHADGPEEYIPLFWFWTACHLGLCSK